MQSLDDIFSTFGHSVTIAETLRGPTVTRYVLKLGNRTRVSALIRLSDDIAHRAGLSSVRIGQSGPSVFLEAPNAERETVTLDDIRGQANKSMELPAWLGLDSIGRPLAVDLAAMPHCLIGGTTGSGKSVCVNTILASLLLSHSPRSLRLLLIDPKQVEFAPYDGLPHLIEPVVSDMSRAAESLRALTDEMEARYELLAESGSRNLAAYNQSHAPLPYIVACVDELADLIMLHGRTVEMPIVRIAQKARAVGIHLILATQRPDRNVVTGLIKSNMPTRIAFRVNSSTDSRIILDRVGAERLLGRGDLLYSSPAQRELIRAQGCFIGDSELFDIIEQSTAYPEPAAIGESSAETAPEPGADWYAGMSAYDAVALGLRRIIGRISKTVT